MFNLVILIWAYIPLLNPIIKDDFVFLNALVKSQIKD